MVNLGLWYPVYRQLSRFRDVPHYSEVFDFVQVFERGHHQAVDQGESDETNENGEYWRPAITVS
jgi:hypothetical protein